MTTIILLALFAIVLVAVFWDQRKALDKVTDFEARMVESLTNIKNGLENRIDRYIETHNATVDHYDQQIDDIIQRMNQIVEDIKRIDHDEKDLRSYYVNYRTPEVSDHGVEWAKDFPIRRNRPMAMTRKQVKEFVDNIENWRIVPGNQYVQVALLDFKDLHFANIMERHDRSIYRYITAKDMPDMPDIQWCTGTYHIYDPDMGVLVYSISKTQIENKIYEVQKA